MEIFQFKVEISYIKNPPVWRRLCVSSKTTFDEFHQIIQAGFGWQDYHFYQFSEKGFSSNVVYKIPDEYDEGNMKDSRTALISEVFNTAGQKYTYIYDFGDNWRHDILLEEITVEDNAVPLCLDGGGACPPEDCGGPPGYENLVKVLNGPKTEESKDLRRWLGFKANEKWDVNKFDVNAANQKLEVYRLLFE